MGHQRRKKKKVNHVAIIMDGNGRWAKKKFLNKKEGHKTGIKNCIKLCKSLNSLNYKINELSFYVFSTENWNRSPAEVNNLFSLIEEFYKNFESTANENNLIIRHYGSRDNLSKKIINIIDSVTNKTKKNSGIYINLLFNYGSRKEIEDAYNRMISSGKKYPKIREYLYTKYSCDPDLIIRTGGEQRLSNFMLWQAAYSELYFTKKLWPDFRHTDLDLAISNYFLRKRNLGK